MNDTDPEDILFAEEMIKLRYPEETDAEFLPDPDLVKIFDTREI